MALSTIDRELLERCLNRQEQSWEDFVDRFVGLVIHVVNHAAQSRSIRLTPQDREDLAAEVFLAVIDADFAVLRRFRKESSLATYLTVVARRVVVRELLKRKGGSTLGDAAGQAAESLEAGPQVERRLDDREEIERLLGELSGSEADVVRMYHLEGKTYQEISSQIGMSENSIGPTLSRARAKMRRAGTADSAT